MRGKLRYAIFVHEPDGDMGLGTIVGAFHSQPAAVAKAAKIEARANKSAYLPDVECIVLPLLPGNASAMAVMEEVTG